MSISLRTQKMLWGRAANRCAICRTELIISSNETDDESIVGDVCHIVSRSQDGPRGESDLTSSQRNTYNNLILLCKVHHKQIDDQPNEFSVEKLQEIKSEHEKWIQDSLEDFDNDKQRDDELYAGYIDDWERQADLENWLVFSSHALSFGQPKLEKDRDSQLDELRLWLLARVWPGRYPPLEEAFENFRHVLQDFHEIFRKHSVEHGEYWLITKKIYHMVEGDQKQYERLLKKYDFHVALVQDLMLELTRAANYVCDQIRIYIFPSYRINEGVLLVQSGPFFMMDFHTLRVEYLDNERSSIPYPGLKDFLIIRKNRDLHFGEGTSIDDPNFSVGKIDINDLLDNPFIN